MVIKNIDLATIAKKFLVRGININPKAAELLCEYKDLDEIISEVCKIANGKFIISEDDVRKAIENLSKKRTQVLKEEQRQVKRKETEIKILKDVTGSSVTEGKIEDFIYYFQSRYEKLARILRSRIPSVQIGNIGKINSENISVIGMISSIRESKNCYFIELEDPTGRITCVASKTMKVVEELVCDEVIGVTGKLRGRNLFVDRIYFPDIPSNDKKIKKDFAIAFISDTHFGSREFLKKEWKVFTKWLNCELGNKKSRELASTVKYVVVAGDIVDGVGVYPGQERDLEVVDIYEQYELAASFFEEIPSKIKVIISPGNHDAVRQAEPQPALPKEIQELFPKNVHHVGNPSYIDLDGVKVLVYHGRSIDDMVMKIPRLKYEEPHKVLEEFLRKRHLCPLYGARTPIAPEREDYLVIEDIPDVLHCGHVHTYGTGFYRGVFLVNSSTWQEQTEFQKKINLNPMPGNVTVYVPGGEVVRLRFYGG